MLPMKPTIGIKSTVIYLTYVAAIVAATSARGESRARRC